jgi:hypothetical protein
MGTVPVIDYLFSGGEYIQVTREDTGPGVAGFPAKISDWGWPDGFGANGIDALCSGRTARIATSTNSWTVAAQTATEMAAGALGFRPVV